MGVQKMAKKTLKKIIFLIITILVIFLCSCSNYSNKYYFYDSNGMYYKDRNLYLSLFKEVTNSVAGCQGISIKYKGRPNIVVLEMDDYDRILYFYEEYSDLDIQCYLISQKIDDDYIYYYEDINFILQKDYKEKYGTIDELKSINDWNKELKIEKCKKIRIDSTKKSYSFKNNKIENLIKDRYPNFTLSNYCYLTNNNDGLFILYLNGYNIEKRMDIIIVINEEYNHYDDYILELTDDNLYNYQNQLKQLKEINKWY